MGNFNIACSEITAASSVGTVGSITGKYGSTVISGTSGVPTVAAIGGSETKLKSGHYLIEAAGSHYDISQGVASLEKYNSFVPTITRLKKIVNSDAMNIAVIGTPCQIMSIRKMQQLGILPAHIVKYAFGLFCNLNFSFDAVARARMEERFDFSFMN